MSRPKKILLAVLVLFLVSLSGVSYYYWYMNAHYVSTEDAYVDGTVLRVGPQMAGKLVEVRVSEGDKVAAGDVLARVDDAALPPGGNTDLLLVKAPAAGEVLKVLAHAGEVVGAGQPVVMLADPEDVYLTVNVEEKKIDRVRLGQRVTFTVDGIPGRTFTGKVVQIQDAVASTFSLLPTRTTSGSFIKVVQRVPVKVFIENRGDAPLRLGQSAVVRIHIRG
ncbi:MAG: Biotin/lipoyl attachment domain-containing protein [Clostridia bacterium 62_21]|nr:MAG: Biotin/lipoyl attachment domain-containing protein [Clostridia bacterium 62_21]